MCNKMSMSEAGKLGAIASKTITEKQKQERIEAYNKNPKICLHCNKPLEYKNNSQKRFCNNSCAAIFNNHKRLVSWESKMPKCLFCNKKLCKRARSYCSIACHKNYDWLQTKKIIESEQKASPWNAKRYLLEKQGHKCAIPHCGISEWHGQPVLLICDHINGNSEDCTLTNLRLICSNCDAQTPFYKGKNRGNGRHIRRQRYKEGKSS